MPPNQCAPNKLNTDQQNLPVLVAHKHVEREGHVAQRRNHSADGPHNDCCVVDGLGVPAVPLHSQALETQVFIHSADWPHNDLGLHSTGWGWVGGWGGDTLGAAQTKAAPSGAVAAGPARTAMA